MSDDRDSWPQAAQRWLGIVGLVVAPTTLVTGLAYFFGSISTGHRLSYFAVNSQAVGFTTADYVVSTVGTLFFPIVRMLLIFVVLALAAALIHRLARADRYTRLIRRTACGVMAVGVVALVRAVLGVIPGAWLPDDKIWLTPLSLSVGTLLLVAGYWMLATIRKPSSPRPPAPVERAGLGLAVAIIVVGLFWSTDIYAADFGANAGAFTADELWRRDDRGVILDTTNPLFLPDYMVKQSVLHAGPASRWTRTTKRPRSRAALVRPRSPKRAKMRRSSCATVAPTWLAANWTSSPAGLELATSRDPCEAQHHHDARQ